MLKPDSPFQASTSMADSLEFIKKLWGSMGVPGTSMPGMTGIPGMTVPTLSVEDLRKKIAELRAVESWLELNINMLRATIQALEVQAATIATLQSMGQSMNDAMAAASASRPGPAEPPHEEAPPPTAEPSEKDQADAAAFTAPLVNAAAWWNQLQDQFKQAVTQAMAEAPRANGHDKSASPPRKRAGTGTASAKPKSTASTARKRKPSSK